MNSFPYKWTHIKVYQTSAKALWRRHASNLLYAVIVASRKGVAFELNDHYSNWNAIYLLLSAWERTKNGFQRNEPVFAFNIFPIPVLLVGDVGLHVVVGDLVGVVVDRVILERETGTWVQYVSGRKKEGTFKKVQKWPNKPKSKPGAIPWDICGDTHSVKYQTNYWNPFLITYIDELALMALWYICTSRLDRSKMKHAKVVTLLGQLTSKGSASSWGLARAPTANTDKIRNWKKLRTGFLNVFISPLNSYRSKAESH